jgi:single-strand DNA-binding protein
MADLNCISLTGRLTRDAEQKTLPTGTTLVTFDIANNTGWGQYAKTMYFTCNVWGKQGTGLLQYLHKGKTVAVSGALEVQKWTSNQDGMEKQKMVISCRDCILMADSNATPPPATPPEYDDSVQY